MDFKWIRREIIDEILGPEIIIEKRYNLFKDKYKNRLWVFLPQDPVLKQIEEKIGI